jgi:apolipoprotein N-acyltransferase
MTVKQSDTIMKEDRWSYLWLAIGALLFVVGNGRWTIPLAAWLWPVFMLRFVRTQKPFPGLIAAAVVFMVGCNIQWIGIMQGPLFIILNAAMGLVFTFTYLVDRLITPRFQGILSTLVFPLTWTTMEYLGSFGPFGAWGSVAYTQFGNLPLEQMVSVTGIYGITFLIAWLASVVNAAWGNEFAWLKIRGIAVLYIGILAMVLLLGGARLAFFPVDSKTVRVASIVAPSGQNIITLLSSKEPRRIPPVGKTIEAMENLSREGASVGAKIVNWHEYGLLVAKRDEALFIDHACKLAVEKNIYLLLALGVFNEEPGSRGENKLVFIEPSGKVLWQYHKPRPVPVIEEPYVVKSEDKAPAITDTSFGKIAAVICFDEDFPSFIRKAGQAGADILFGPSEDWREILSIHTQAISFRAVENGFSLVRCTFEGLTMAVDYQGRVLTATDDFRNKEPVIISDVPMKGVTTIYSKIGDVFAWLCCAGFAMIVAWVLLRRKAVDTSPDIK